MTVTNGTVVNDTDELLKIVKVLQPLLKNIQIERHKHVPEFEPKYVLLDGKNTVNYILAQVAKNICVTIANNDTGEWQHNDAIDKITQHSKASKKPYDQLADYLKYAALDAVAGIPQGLIKYSDYTVVVSIAPAADTDITGYSLIAGYSPNGSKHQFTKCIRKKAVGNNSLHDTMRIHASLTEPLFKAIMYVAEEYLTGRTASSNDAMINLSGVLASTMSSYTALRLCDLISNLIELKFDGDEKYEIIFSKPDLFA